MKRKLLRLLSDVNKHDIFILSGSLAYTTALALAPFLIIVVSAISALDLGDQNLLIEQLRELLGNQAGEAAEAVVKSATQNVQFSGLSGIISFLIIVVSASAIFSQLRLSLDKINEHEYAETNSGLSAFLHEKVFSVGLVLGFIFLLVTSLFVNATLAVVLGTGEGLLWKGLSLLVNALVFSVLFTAMFRFIPSDRFSWSRCLVSGACATVFFLTGKTLIGLYLAHSAVGSAYGAAGSLVALLVWLYYTSMTLLISYEFTNEILLEDGHSAGTKRASAGKSA